jgi:phosphatidylglycerol:prolipoprotein diacylglycerol transferase
MGHGFVHRIDPIIGSIGGIHLWWYGLSYTLGLLNLYWYLRRARHRLEMTRTEVQSLALFIAIGVLVGGRAVEVAFDEWPFYRENLALIPAYWLGGMATHGLLAGAAAGAGMFSRLYRKPFRPLADALVVPGALLMGMGRIGNFIDGAIVGSITDVWWGIQFPHADGFRHPVVLYDGAKNILLAPYLLRVRATNAAPGATASRFVFWYAFPRIFIDLLRDYPTHRLALGTGQTLNIVMALVGMAVVARTRRRRCPPEPRSSDRDAAVAADAPAPLWQSAAFVSLVVFCLVLPSNWTQDVPARYGARHPGLVHSKIYPQIDTAPSSKARRASAGAGWQRQRNMGGLRVSPRPPNLPFFCCPTVRDYGSGLILTLRNSMSCPVRCRPIAPLLNCG